MEPNFSIIIPHYNIPDLLMRCLKSIPVCGDIQVIVVDDNSPDAATYLERFPELSRPYLEFIRTTKGGGAGYARNIGMQHAQGKWLVFADADDLFADGMYDIIRKWEDSDAEVICFKIRSVMSDDMNKELDRMTHVNKYIDEYLSSGDDRFIRLRYPTPWGKMYRKELVERHGFGFDEIQYANDNFFSVCTGYYARKVEAAGDVLYVYTARRGSLTETFGLKPGELAIRTDVSFRIQKMFKALHVDIDQQRPFKWYLMKLLGQDRTLFKYYWKRVDEAYPSKYTALKTLSKGKNLKFKLKLCLYSLWIWYIDKRRR